MDAVLVAGFNSENSSSLSFSKKKLYAKYSPSEKRLSFLHFPAEMTCVAKLRIARGRVVEPSF